jgi:hypothetical protein
MLRVREWEQLRTWMSGACTALDSFSDAATRGAAVEYMFSAAQMNKQQ